MHLHEHTRHRIIMRARGDACASTSALFMTHDPLALRTHRPLAHSARRVVVKLGTAVLVGGGDGNTRWRVDAFVRSLVALQQSGRDVLLVTSGAVRRGAELLGMPVTPAEYAEARLCAAVGQGSLMASYANAAAQLGASAAQLLLTARDMTEPRSLAILRSTLSKLLQRRILPVINENDALAAPTLPAGEARTPEYGFGDNDRLAALLATQVGADMLLILTDVPGLMTADPRVQPGAQLVPIVQRITPLLVDAAGGPRLGRGGMRSKLEAARIATDAGCAVVLADGRDAGIIERVCDGEPVGTLFLPRPWEAPADACA